LSQLAALLRRVIREEGPIDVGRYMALALAHPQHGYYTSRDPLGAAGDFVTAPEISQLFGELLGLALVQSWLDAARPAPVRLVELGPGRGTLMADALRAAAVVPEFLEAAELHLVEASPILRARQAELLDEYNPHWHTTLQTVPTSAPLLLLANEFFDALPTRQFVRSKGRWHERLVALDAAGAFAFALSPVATPLPLPDVAEPPEGAVLEVSPAREALAQELGRRLAEQGGLALVIDYGERHPSLADTLQATRDHAPVDPLSAPGETDLTAHVDFGALAGAARLGGADAWGPLPQGEFLERLGIRLRLERLLQAATKEQAEDLNAGAERLTAPDAMGDLFGVLALTRPSTPPPPGFLETDLYA
jgi:NADH dehydrogenase [ubiquinone] 1 alpha subcomplex assembly factor 7